MSSFRKPIPVIRRPAASYVNGIWTIAPDPEPVDVLMTIQPGGLSEYEILVTLSRGRHFREAFKCYTSAKLNCAGEGDWPGDLVLFRGKQLLTVGMMDRHSLDSEVSHYRYYLINEVPKGEG